MIDRSLRVAKERLLEPVALRLSGVVSPGLLTALSLAGGLGAGVAAGFGLYPLAVACWLMGRLCDGLDGTVARTRGATSDLGGYFDMMGDTVGYAAVPLGIAVAHADQGVWVWCAVLLATFYLNTMSWTYLAAVAEKRGAGAAAAGELTSVHMPTGLVEGTETIVLYVLMLAFPAQARGWFMVMSALVIFTIGQRIVWAAKALR